METSDIENNRRKLYEAISSMEFDDLGSFETYNSKMDDEGNRRKLYDAIAGDFDDIGTWEEFDAKMSQRTLVPKMPFAEVSNMAKDMLNGNGDSTNEDTQSEGEPWQPSGSDLASIQSSIDRGISNFNASASENIARTGRLAETYSPEGRAQASAAKRQAQLMGAPTSVTGLAGNGIQENTEDEANAGKSDGRPLMSTRSPEVHGVKIVDGKAQTEWMLPDGRLSSDIMDAHKAESGARDVRLMRDFLSRMKNNGLDPSDKEDIEKQRKLDENDRKAVTLPGKIREMQQRISEIERRITERNQELSQQWEEIRRKDKGFFSGYGVAIGSSQTNDSDEELRALRLSLQQAHKSLQQLTNAQDQIDNGNGFWRGFGRAIWQTISDIRTWDFGYSDLVDTRTMLDITSKANKGEKLTDNEQRAMEDIAINQAVMSQFGDLGKGYRWGNMAGISLSFIKDFWITGGYSKLPGIATKGLTKAAKGLGTSFANDVAKRAARRGILQFVRKEGMTGVGALIKEQSVPWMVKALGTTADDLLMRAPLMAVTVQGMSTASEIIRHKLGNVKYNPETSQYKFANGETWSNAIWQAGADKVIENFSEMWGGHLPGMADIAKAFGARNLTAAVLRNTREGANTVISKAANFLKRTGVNGYFGEVGEEYYGQLWRTMLRLDSAYDENGMNLFHSRQFHGDILGGMALSIGLTGSGAVAISSGMKYGGKAVDYYMIRNTVNRTDRMAGSALSPDVWNPMRLVIDATDNANIGELAQQVWNDPSMTEQQKAAVLDYMEASMVMRGHNLREFVTQDSEKELTGRNAMADAYIEGMNIGSAEDRNRTRMSLDYQADHLRNTLKLADNADINSVLAAMYGTDDINTIITQLYNDNTVSEADRSAITEYLIAANRYNGMMQAVHDAIETEVAGQTAFVDNYSDRSDPENPVMRPAMLKNDNEQVFIISGNAVMMPDGSMVDRANSDSFIIIRDLNGNVRSIDAADIQTVADPENAADAKARIAEQIRTGRMAEYQAQINGNGKGESITDTNQPGSEPRPVGRAVMKIDDRPVEVLSGRVVMMDGSTMIDSEHSDTSIVIRDLATGQIETVSPEAILSYEEYAPAEQPVVNTQPDDAAIGQPKYTSGQIKIRNSDGSESRGVLTGYVDEDGKHEYYVEGDLQRLHYATESELDNILSDYQPDEPVQPETTVNNPNGIVPENTETVPNPAENTAPVVENKPEAVSTAEPTPLQRIPRDEKGEPIFEQAETPELAWDALVEYSEGDTATAKEIADSMAEEKKKVFEKAQKLKLKGKTPAEMLASRKANAAELAKAQSEYEHWQNMANVEQYRRDAIRSQQEAEDRRLAEQQAQAEEAERVAREEAARIEREALEGIPEWHMDTPENARARGARRFSGELFTRQGPVHHVPGKEVMVKFSQKDLPKGRIAVIEASQLQPSHVQGNRNPMFFIDEAQPKNRAEAVSTYAAQQIAEDIRPEEITGSTTAYTGAPTVNLRGEVIQGNNRSDALRYLWDNNLARQQEAYRQYIIDNAGQLGLDAEAINAMQHPVLVNMLDVNDAEAIRLGQMTAQDTESGGIERIKPKNVSQKLGDDMRQFANMLLRTDDEEATFGQLVDRNGTDVIKWMSQVGAISNTQYQSAFDSKGNLTAEAKNDLRKVLYQAVFKGGSQQLEEMFDRLPAKAQRAILSTAFRDMDSPIAGRMLPEIQASIIAYDLLMADHDFAAARKMVDVLRAVDAFKHVIALDDRFEQYMPADNFSNFALHLAAMYKTSDMSQTTIASIFNQMYDLAQGKKAATLFENADTTQYPLADVIKKVLNIDYKPAKNGNNNVANGGADVALRDRISQEGQLRGNEPPASGKQTPAGTEPSDRGAGVTADSRGSGTPQQDRADKKEEVRSLTADEAIECVADMEHNAPVAQQMPLTVENWDDQFPDGIVTTPIGEVKMGEHQFLKLMREGRNSKLGMIKPTLEHPYIIVEVNSEAKEGDTTERPTSYIFIKSFKKADGSRYYYFTSISVSKDGMEVVVSNQEKSRNKILRLLTEGSVIWRAPKDAATASVEQQGLEYVQPSETETATNGSGITPQSTSISSTKPVSASSSDIETELKGKRNSMSTPKSELYSHRKDNKSLSSRQIQKEESSAQIVEDKETQTRQIVGRNLSIDEAENLIALMEDKAIVAPEIELTPENWIEQFGEDGRVRTPLGEVKLGENQFIKLFSRKRAEYFGMMYPTLSTPDVVIEKNAPSEGAERDTKFLFIKTFVKPNGGRIVHFESITVQRDGMEVSVSSHEAEAKDIKKDMQKEKILHISERLSPSSEWSLTEAPQKAEGPDLVPTSDNIVKTEKSIGKMTDTDENPTDSRGDTALSQNSNVSDGKDSHRSSYKQTSSQESSAPYTITSATYTNKKGKETPMHRLEFGRELTKEEESAVKKFASEKQGDGRFAPARGWKDRENGGWLFRTEEDARKAGILIGNKNAIADEAPLSVDDMRPAEETHAEIESSVNGVFGEIYTQFKGKVKEAVDFLLSNKKGDLIGVFSREGFGEVDMVWGDKSGGFSHILDKHVGEGKSFATADEAAEAIHDIITNGDKDFENGDKVVFRIGNKLVTVRKNFREKGKKIADKNWVLTAYDETAADGSVSAITSGNQIQAAPDTAETEHKVSEKSRSVQTAKPINPSGNRLVTDEQYADYLARFKKKLGGQLNMGVDPEILQLGAMMAVYHIEKGARKFAAYVRAMVHDLGEMSDKVPYQYLKGFYKNAHSMLEYEMPEIAEEMDNDEIVNNTDVATIVNGHTDAIASAKMVTAEQQAEKERVEAEHKLKEMRNDKRAEKSISLQKQRASLFDNIEEISDNNGQETDLEVSTGQTGGQRQQRQPYTEVGGNESRSEIERPAGRTSGGRTGVDTGDNTGRGRGVSGVHEGAKAVAPADRRNVNNNRAERGTDYAPKSADARIKANIRAIRLAQELTEAGQQATPEQMKVLRQFSGWGGLGTAFSNAEYSRQLRELLGEEAYEEANLSRHSAYYTPAHIIDAMWDIAANMGFRGGRVLEGSAGIGNILGLMPEAMSGRSAIQAVEFDSTTGAILKLLYPDVQVDIKGFEKTQIENGSVDLAITNVPFSTDMHVHDDSGDSDLSRKFRHIHDFCIAKNIRKLREGGIGIFITSNGTLDSSDKLRAWIGNEGNCDVVGAFRLHNQTFGGTPTTSDIIVVRKRVNGKKSAHAIDITSVSALRTVEYDTGETRKVKGQEVPVVKTLPMIYNSYFVEHPENMGGEMQFNFERGETYRAEACSLFPSRDKDQSKMLQTWAQSFADMDFEQAEAANDFAVEYDKVGNEVKTGTMVIDSQGRLCVNRNGEARPLYATHRGKNETRTDAERIEDFNKKKINKRSRRECLEDYNRIKRALAAVLDYQTNNEGDEELQPLLDELNRTYDTFVAKYRYFHNDKAGALSWLKNDVDYPSVVALESFSQRNDAQGNPVVKFGKTDIFTRRVVEKEAAPTPRNVRDGVLASMYLNGRIDIPYIADALGITEDDAKQQIVESGLGFENPLTREVEVSYEYLSGNVREKLRQAREQNTDGRYTPNVSALERVIPMDIPAHLIEFTLGSSWIEPKLYEDFIKERTGVSVKLTNAGGTWAMTVTSGTINEKNRSAGVYSDMLKKTIFGHELMEAALRNVTLTVKQTYTKYVNGRKETETVTDKDATQVCANRVNEIRDDFKDWARGRMQADAEMAARVETVYNERFNNSVPREIPDEFIPGHFGGQVTTMKGEPFSLRPHQAKAVIRGTMQSQILAHEVGTGKTYTLITTAMEMRRLGTARKPMIVVQNATVGQFVESAKALYPNAKVLTLEDADRDAEGRRNFYAKIKYNDWDMIVVPQSVFERIPDSAERRIKFIQDKIAEKEMVLEQMKAEDPDSILVKEAEREIEKAEEELADIADESRDKQATKDEKREAKAKHNAKAKAEEMLDRDVDDIEDFDQMGIDALLVDEAHEYKHLGFETAMKRGVKGVDPSYSKKAQGVYLKCQAVMERSKGRNVIFATGTPISNTAAEIWTFMRYLMPADTMREYDIYYFDDFVRNFGNLQNMLEFSTSGKFKENNRFAGYVNLPELVRIWSTVADTVLTREAGAVQDKIPEVESGKATDIFLPQTRALRSIMLYVKSELDRFENMSGKEKKANSHIPLVCYGIAKAAAVDARLVQADAYDDPNSKTNEAVRQTIRSLKDSEGYHGTVAIFADNYRNKYSGFNLYEDIRGKLIQQGVPADQIVIMTSGMSIKKKLEIFDKVNRGEVRVIMGSTFTLGTGVNIQERLHTLIHVDAPNRPMDYTQRNGRILRQGNLHKVWGIPVRVLRFGVEDSLDVTAYQRLKTKGAIADSVMNGKELMSDSMNTRTLEEAEDVFGDITAQLSGSEYAMLKNQAERELRKYTAKMKAWEADQTYIHNQKRTLSGQNQRSQEIIDEAKAALATIERLFGDEANPAIEINGSTFANIEAMADFIKKHNAAIKEAEEGVKDGRLGDRVVKTLTIKVGGVPFVLTTSVSRNIGRSLQGDLFNQSQRDMTYSCEALGLTDQPVNGKRLLAALEDIMGNVITGKDYRERIEAQENVIERNNTQLAAISERDGKPFEYEKELEEAKVRLAEYTEKMKAEMAEKEAKYAGIDATVDAASNVEYEADDESENTTNEPGPSYNSNRNRIFADKYETQDGKTINYTSENPEAYGIPKAKDGTDDSRTGAADLQRQGNSGLEARNNRLNTELGEFSLVERVFKETGAFNFTSGERIESADDVAFIFSSLEDAAKEHAFMVLVKDGDPTVVELGMGTFTASLVDIPTASLAYNRIKPDQVYFVHNHPSGNLKCSPEDMRVLETMERMTEMPVHGVIINLKTGKYGTFGKGELSSVGYKRIPETELPLKVHTLDKQIFARDYDPMSQPMVRDSEDVAKFLNSHRMGDRAKVSFLIISRAGRIVGNIHTPFIDITNDVTDKARYISDRITQFGGESAILYGDFAINYNNSDAFQRLKQSLQQVGGTNLLDVVNVEGNYTRSARDEGMLYEPGSEYGASDDSMRYRLGDGKESFSERQRKAVENRGTVMPWLNDAEVKVVEVPPHSYKGEKPLSQAVDAAIDRYAGKRLHYDNHGQEFDYTITKRDLVYSANHFSKSENVGVHAAVMDKLDAVINESIEVVEHADVRKIDGGRNESNGINSDVLMHRFVGAVQIGGTSYRVITTLREVKSNDNNRLHTYEVTKIGVLDGFSSRTPNGISVENESQLGVASLLKGVDIHNKSGEKILQESKIAENNLQWVDKEKGHEWLSSASQRVQQEIATKDLEDVAKIVDSFENPTLSEAESLSGDVETMRGQGAELAARLHTPVRFIDNVEEITDNDVAMQRKKRSAKGWYDTIKGDVVMVLPNCDNVADVESTIFHEVVGHKGMREIVGEKNFGQFLREVYDHASKTTRANINALIAKNGWDVELATEEYIAQLAEKGFEDMEAQEQSFWAKVKSKVLDFLKRLFEGRKLPKSISIGDNEIRYMLWRTYQQQTDDSLVGEAENVLMQQRLGVGRFRENLSVTDRIESLFNEAVKGNLTGKPVEIGRLTSEGRSYLERLSGLKLKEDVSFVLNPSDLVHIHKRHFGSNEKDGRNIPLTNDDIKAIASIVSNPDRVIYAKEKKGNERNLFFFLKEDDTGSYNLLEVYADRKGNLTSKSFFKSKEGVSQRVISLQNDPTLYVRDGWGNPLDSAKLPKLFELTKSRESSHMRFRSTIKSPAPGVARDYYEKKVRRPNESGTVKWHENVLWRLHEGYLDSMAALKALMDGIAKEKGLTELPSYADPYKAENAMTSASKAQTDEFKRDYVRPMQKSIIALMKKGAAYEDVKCYLISKHGLERNEVLAKRDFDTNLKENPTSTKTIDDFRKKDYSGLTGLFSKKNVTDAEAEATSFVNEFESKYGELVNDMWNAINAATNATLKKQYDAWMMSKATFDNVSGMFNYYIPLRGWDSNVAADEYYYNGTSQYLHGSPILKTAKGRTSVADDPIATIAYMGERSIASANRNKMKQRFLNFISENPTSLASVHQQWYIKDAAGNWMPSDPIIPADADGDTINNIVSAHEASMKVLKAKGNATRKRNGLKLGMNTSLWQQDEHKVRVKHGDREFVIYINGNPAAAHALNGLTNPDSKSGPVESKLTAAKSKLSALLTSLNPAFIAANMLMDCHMAIVATAIKEDSVYNRVAAGNALKIYAAMPKLLREWDKGTLDDGDKKKKDSFKKMEKYFKEFMLNGGETGFTQMHTINDYKKSIAEFQRQVTEGIGKKTLRIPQKAWHLYWNTIERLNRSAEDATRFIIYMTSRQQGRDIVRSIADAKDITVNFNRKGSGRLGQRQMNFCYYFFNAAMQSVANFGRLIKHNPKKTAKVLFSHVAMGFLIPMLNQLLLFLWGDEDDKEAYWELPEWQRRNNLVIYVPFTKGMFLTIPLAHELRPFYGIGEAACGVSLGHDELGNGIASAVAGFTSMMPIDYTGNGGNPLINLTPSIAQPVAQVIGNVDYFGKPVYQDSPNNERDPEHTKAYKGTSPIFVEASKLLNSISGGDDVRKKFLSGVATNPDVMEHLFNGYTGGAGKTLVQFTKGLQMLWDKDMREVRNAPIVSRFVTHHDQRSRDMNLNNTYYELIDEYEQTDHDLSGYRKAMRIDSLAYGAKLSELMASDAFLRYQRMHGYKKAIDKLRRAIKNAPPENIVELERKLYELKMEMIDSVQMIQPQHMQSNR